jgi:hypothetical protein
MDQSAEGMPFYLNGKDWRDSGNSAEALDLVNRAESHGLASWMMMQVKPSRKTP